MSFGVISEAESGHHFAVHLLPKLVTLSSWCSFAYLMAPYTSTYQQHKLRNECRITLIPDLDMKGAIASCQGVTMGWT